MEAKYMTTLKKWWERNNNAKALGTSEISLHTFPSY